MSGHGFRPTQPCLVFITRINFVDHVEDTTLGHDPAGPVTASATLRRRLYFHGRNVRANRKRGFKGLP